jgi:hypothetical protein
MDYPPCWLVETEGPDFGRVEYFLNITIGDEGIAVAKGWPERRAQEALSIPGVSDVLDQALSQEDFLAQAAPILEWSAERDCRHYVRVFDRAESKRAFKAHLLATEAYFYKWLEPS